MDPLAAMLEKNARHELQTMFSYQVWLRGEGGADESIRMQRRERALLLLQMHPSLSLEEVQHSSGFTANPFCQFLRTHDVTVAEIKTLHEANPVVISLEQGPRHNRRLPLHFACEKGNRNLETIEFLANEFPQAVKTRCSNNKLPIHIFLKNRVCGERERFPLQVLQCLIEHCPECLLQPTNYASCKTLLEFAIRFGLGDGDAFNCLYHKMTSLEANLPNNMILHIKNELRPLMSRGICKLLPHVQKLTIGAFSNRPRTTATIWSGLMKSHHPNLTELALQMCHNRTKEWHANFLEPTLKLNPQIRSLHLNGGGAALLEALVELKPLLKGIQDLKLTGSRNLPSADLLNSFLVSEHLPTRLEIDSIRIMGPVEGETTAVRYPTRSSNHLRDLTLYIDFDMDKSICQDFFQGSFAFLTCSPSLQALKIGNSYYGRDRPDEPCYDATDDVCMLLQNPTTNLERLDLAAHYDFSIDMKAVFEKALPSNEKLTSLIFTTCDNDVILSLETLLLHHNTTLKTVDWSFSETTEKEDRSVRPRVNYWIKLNRLGRGNINYSKMKELIHILSRCNEDEEDSNTTHNAVDNDEDSVDAENRREFEAMEEYEEYLRDEDYEPESLEPTIVTSVYQILRESSAYWCPPPESG